MAWPGDQQAIQRLPLAGKLTETGHSAAMPQQTSPHPRDPDAVQGFIGQLTGPS